ncbi:hypothetical protein AQI96_32200 [Streptomyces canus]|nr:hypothetical protein AQI96_32200 [Streptomyces canus]
MLRQILVQVGDARRQGELAAGAFTTEDDGTQDHRAGSATGWSGRTWYRLTARLRADRPALAVRHRPAVRRHA